jgi:hypothetical protein
VRRRCLRLSIMRRFSVPVNVTGRSSASSILPLCVVRRCTLFSLHKPHPQLKPRSLDMVLWYVYPKCPSGFQISLIPGCTNVGFTP